MAALASTSAAVEETNTVATSAQTSAQAETSTAAATTSETSASQAATSTSATPSTSSSTQEAGTSTSSSTSSAAASTSSSTAASTSTVVVTESSSSSSSARATSTSTADSTTTSSSSSSSASPSTTVVTVTTSAQTVPGYVTTTSRVAASSAAASGSGSKSGSSSLPVGGIVGIAIGGLAVVAVIAFFLTRYVRKRSRAKRTAARSSMFEPWTAPAVEDEPYEKPAYDNPEPSYPMTHAGAAATGAYGAYGHESSPYDAAAAPYEAYPPQQFGHGEYVHDPSYPGGAYEGAGAMAGVGVAGAAGAGAAGAAAPSPAAAHGLHDGMMVRVKVGFVRSLEDELAITPGQQLYLHNAYDDGWSLCEDQAENRGVVPISCLEPWEEPQQAEPVSGATAAPSHEEQQPSA